MSDRALVDLLAIIGVFYLPFIGIAGYLCHRAIRSWHETWLKRDMVARGFTAQEIIEVIAAERGSNATATAPLSDVPPAKPVKQPAYSA